MTNRQIHIVELPKGKLGPEHFRLAEGAMPQPKEGELLLRTRLISLDAANRAWMQGATYRAAIEAGQVMAGGAVAEVIEARAPGFAAGDLVFADTGWQEYAALPARHCQKQPRIEPISHLLSVYGVAGLTAYFGLLNVGRPRAGETVVVSAAAGSVGVFVGQIAKLKGCHVVGIAGGGKKCAWLKDELGFDAVIDYKAEAVGGALKKAAPKGIDVYFDNVGGTTLEAALRHARVGARFPVCGMISGYNALEDPGIRGLHALLVKRIQMTGFIIYDHVHQLPAYLARVGPWVRRGEVVFAEDIVQGIEQAPAALIGMLRGEAIGKRLVQVAPETAG